jgi:hypothetical protein
MIKPIALLTVVMTLALPDVHAISIGEAEGVKILQTSHVIDAMTIENTSSGSLELNLNRLRSDFQPRLHQHDDQQRVGRGTCWCSPRRRIRIRRFLTFFDLESLTGSGDRSMRRSISPRPS